MGRVEPGTPIAVRTHRLGQIRTAKAAIVVENIDAAISYWWPAGASWMVSSATTVPRSEMFEETMHELHAGTWETAMVPWQHTDVLATTIPGSWAVVWHMCGRETGDFLCWYVDLKRPHMRTRVGFDTRDLDLDIVVGPDLSWAWKDEDEFEARYTAGFITDAEAQEVRATGEAMIPLIEAGTAPFDSSMVDWRPDPSWPIPAHPECWTDPPLA